MSQAIATEGGPVIALNAHYYTDPAVYDDEKRQIFARTWQFACHESDLANQGDFVAFEVCDQPLFVVRDRDHEIRGFHNVCMHRAHLLVEGSGNARSLVCPYHSWTYELDGRLRGAPNQDKVPGFDASTICLTAIRLENFCGFLFVNLDPNAVPMDEWYPDAREELRAYVPDIDRLAPLTWVPLVERCNWKVTVENYSECYHCRLNHPTFAKGVIDPETYNIMPQGHCLRHTSVAANLDRMTYEIDAEANEHVTDYSSWFLWPAFSFQVYPGNRLNTYHWRPNGVTETTVIRGWYEVEGRDPETVLKLAEQDRETTFAEDVRLVESVQRGLNSRGYRPGPLVIDPDFGVNSEHSIRALHEWTRAALAGTGGPTS